jgi:hypothetical protein
MTSHASAARDQLHLCCLIICRSCATVPTTTATPTHPGPSYLPGLLAYAALELLLLHAQSVEAVNGHGRQPTAHPAQDMCGHLACDCTRYKPACYSFVILLNQECK